MPDNFLARWSDFLEPTPYRWVCEATSRGLRKLLHPAKKMSSTYPNKTRTCCQAILLKKCWSKELIERKTLTTRVSTEEKFSNFIVYKDEKTIGKCTKPPCGPVGKTREQEWLQILKWTDYTRYMNSGCIWIHVIHVVMVLTLGDTSWVPHPCLGSRTGRQPGLSLQTSRRSKSCSWIKKHNKYWRREMMMETWRYLSAQLRSSCYNCWQRDTFSNKRYT